MAFVSAARVALHNVLHLHGQVRLLRLTYRKVRLHGVCISHVRCLASTKKGPSIGNSLHDAMTCNLDKMTPDQSPTSMEPSGISHVEETEADSTNSMPSADVSHALNRRFGMENLDHLHQEQTSSDGTDSDSDDEIKSSWTFEEENKSVELSNADLDRTNLKQISQHVVEPQYHLAAYVSESETLSQLVRLGVDLTQLQRVKGAADMIIKLDFETQVKPYLLFLHDIGVTDSHLGNYISKNPKIFNEDLEDLRVRINYLESKKFSKESIARIVSKAYVFLLMPVKTVDAKLGYLQQEYRLTGNEVRAVITRLPKLATWNLQKLKDNRFYIKEFLGFSDAELKQMLVKYPKLFLTNKHDLGRKFDYLYNTMEMSHNTLVEWPQVFRCRLHIIKQRHQFLLSVDRAQYDPTKENYVSLHALVTGYDLAFCENVAKASVIQYNNFLKSI
ncbi:transcription termination factor 3, mitochondrial-like isoform X1 [Haliotis cracherodii]|uniref:transcription termination factor 3, mitochondrial-like isoform X1 n=1 Tax=Haliotis cracherodii TaxID=6455 RepID=UPI0039EC193D